jgi:DNA-binding NarL/FixJ family response regulator
VHVYGAEESDVELFPAVAAEHADVVVIDQHLDYRETHLGTTVIRQLLLMGYRGLVCVRSADGTPADLELYEASGAHLYIGKDVGGDEMIGRLATAYHKHRRNAGRVSTFSIH